MFRHYCVVGTALRKVAMIRSLAVMQVAKLSLSQELANDILSIKCMVLGPQLRRVGGNFYGHCGQVSQACLSQLITIIISHVLFGAHLLRTE